MHEHVFYKSVNNLHSITEADILAVAWQKGLTFWSLWWFLDIFLSWKSISSSRRRSVEILFGTWFGPRWRWRANLWIGARLFGNWILWSFVDLVFLRAGLFRFLWDWRQWCRGTGHFVNNERRLARFSLSIRAIIFVLENRSVRFELLFASVTLVEIAGFRRLFDGKRCSSFFLLCHFIFDHSFNSCLNRLTDLTNVYSLAKNSFDTCVLFLLLTDWRRIIESQRSASILFRNTVGDDFLPRI